MTYLVAIPEHRAKVFKATRSPRSSCRAGPVTVATFAIGENSVPSFMCHSTLRMRIKNIGGLYEQPSCSKTSSKKGTPAKTPWISD
jgi:hypothetical protein